MRTPIRAAAVVILVAGVALTARADETMRVSSSLWMQSGSKASSDPTISADGNLVAFLSEADDLIGSDHNGVADVYLFDRTTWKLSRISVSSSGLEANGRCYAPVISADGRYVAFQSEATNLDVDPNGAVSDIFLRDLVAKTTRIISMDPAGLGCNDESFLPSISSDGGRIAFQSNATNVVPTDSTPHSDIFVWDAFTDSIKLVSTDFAGMQGNGSSFNPIISGNGNVIAWMTWTTNFPNSPPVAGPSLYAKDLFTGLVDRLDVDSNEKAEDEQEQEFYPPSGITDDGSLVIFAARLELDPEDENHTWDVYLRDRVNGVTKRVSRGNDDEFPDQACLYGKISGDGRWLAFHSASAELVPGDMNEFSDVFMRDLKYGVTTRLSVDSDDMEGDGDSYISPAPGGAISADGTVVVFESYATNFEMGMGDMNLDLDVFVRERCMMPASSMHYGEGYRGRYGIPSMRPRMIPVRGSTLTIDVSNSSRTSSFGLVYIGFSQLNQPSVLGGTLLVNPAFIHEVVLPPAGATLSFELPAIGDACGLVVDMQTLQLDAWARYGVSFTEGLELMVGD